jgi:hypothetical protein
VGPDLVRSDGGSPLIERPNIEPILNGLKDFQKRTVDHAFRQLYMEEGNSGRFLVADEVGLGKTMIAKGLIAKAIDFLWEREERIDILYICSNGDIARQNIQRLQLDRSSSSKFAFATRSTLLPVTVKELQKNKVNYISLTPGTSFEMKSSLGMGEERLLLYWLLKDAWQLEGTAPINLLQGDVGMENFRQRLRQFDRNRIDKALQEAFLHAVSQTNLQERFQELASEFRYGRERTKVPRVLRNKQNELVGDLRALLAVTSLGALNPDLIIMDEFQRFKHLFDESTEAGKLAAGLFQHTSMKLGSKILLLSATPYKMYTLHQESDGEDHYRDFVDTLHFLYKNEQQTDEVKRLLEEYRKEMFRLEEHGLENLKQLKEQLERKLRKVMVRTERLSASEDRNGMLQQIVPTTPRLSQTDIKDYVTLQSIASMIDQPDVIEYWKTSPYLLNFMDDYKLKTKFVEALEDPSKNAVVTNALLTNREMFLSMEMLRKYEKIDPRNMRLRELENEYFQTEIWKCLWLPPSLPYYQLGGCFEYAKKPTKRLVFSSWRVVPKVLASYFSYEAERQMFKLLEESPENTPEARTRRRGLLQFAFTDNRLTGMPILTLLYPSYTLATCVDPQRILGKSYSETKQIPSKDAVFKHVQSQMDSLIATLRKYEQESVTEDEVWYWAAPILLDFVRDQEKTLSWWKREQLATIWQLGEEDQSDATHWADHVDRVRALLRGEIPLGRQPSDLPTVLASMALAGPAVCAYRSILRFTSNTQDEGVRDAAAQIGWSFRSLYNVPEITALIRGLKNNAFPYWRKTLEYGVDGCLQSVLDEYIHILMESFGGFSGEAVSELSKKMNEVLSLRAATLSVDHIQFKKDQLIVEPNAFRMRARFAQRFGEEQGEDGKRNRVGQVRDAFNSPFWPFILTTTSVGQEGLDFHPYCHAIVHWDLPSNPVDLEQREGRVHRYKGHAVRKNLALAYQDQLLSRLNVVEETLTPDPWTILFQLAEMNRKEGEGDMIPYWIFPLDNGYKIDRFVPAHQLSRDFLKLNNLRRSLAVYRMVFGQPRQEDLIQFLLEHYDEETTKKIVDELKIDLSPNTEVAEFTR